MRVSHLIRLALAAAVLPLVIGCAPTSIGTPYASPATNASNMTPFEDPSGIKVLVPQGWAHAGTTQLENVYTAKFDGPNAMSISLQCHTGIGGAFLAAPTLREIGIDALRAYEMVGSGWGSFTPGIHHLEADGFDPHFEAHVISVPTDGMRVKLAALIGWRLDNLGQCKYTRQGMASEANQAELASAWLAMLTNLY